MTNKPFGIPPTIAASVDFRGVADSDLHFMFRNVDVATVKTLFEFLIGNGRGIAKCAVVSEEHDIVRRNGYSYWRVVAKVIYPNYSFVEIDDMKILIQSYLQGISGGEVKWMNIDDFLNC